MIEINSTLTLKGISLHSTLVGTLSELVQKQGTPVHTSLKAGQNELRCTKFKIRPVIDDPVDFRLQTPQNSKLNTQNQTNARDQKKRRDDAMTDDDDSLSTSHHKFSLSL